MYIPGFRNIPHISSQGRFTGKYLLQLISHDGRSSVCLINSRYIWRTSNSSKRISSPRSTHPSARGCVEWAGPTTRPFHSATALVTEIAREIPTFAIFTISKTTLGEIAEIAEIAQKNSRNSTRNSRNSTRNSRIAISGAISPSDFLQFCRNSRNSECWNFSSYFCDQCGLSSDSCEKLYTGPTS